MKIDWNTAAPSEELARLHPPFGQLWRKHQELVARLDMLREAAHATADGRPIPDAVLPLLHDPEPPPAAPTRTGSARALLGDVVALEAPTRAQAEEARTQGLRLQIAARMREVQEAMEMIQEPLRLARRDAAGVVCAAIAPEAWPGLRAYAKAARQFEAAAAELLALRQRAARFDAWLPVGCPADADALVSMRPGSRASLLVAEIESRKA